MQQTNSILRALITRKNISPKKHPRRAYYFLNAIMGAVLILVVVCGCATKNAILTDSKISINPVTGFATLSLPKDSSWGWLSFDQTVVSTNHWTNHISLVISNGVFKNNPLVLDAQGAAAIGQIQALGSLIQGVMQAGAAGATKAAVPIP